MAVKLNSYLTFDGNAAEAAEFYRTVFGGEIYIDRFEKFADSMPVKEEDMERVMHAYVKGDNGIELMMSDTTSDMELAPGSQVTLALNGDDETMLKGYWDKLCEGGTVTMPLEKAPWGDHFGMLKDKFGIGWMVDIGPIEQS